MSDKDRLNNMFERMMTFETPKIIKEKDVLCECLTHGPFTAHVVKYDNGNEVLTPDRCPVCEKERKEELARRNSERIYNERIASYKASNVSKEYFDKEFSDFVATTKAQKAALDAVQEMIDTGKGKVVIIGSNGVGKSMLGNLAAKEMGGYIYTMFEIATRIRQSYAPGAKETELDILNELVEAPLLVIDEVGRIRVTEAVLDWFSYIIDKRHTSNKALLILGNLHFSKDCEDKEKGGCPRCFENCFDNDCISRLRENSKIIEIISKDERSEKKTGSFITDRR